MVHYENLTGEKRQEPRSERGQAFPIFSAPWRVTVTFWRSFCFPSSKRCFTARNSRSSCIAASHGMMMSLRPRAQKELTGGEISQTSCRTGQGPRRLGTEQLFWDRTAAVPQGDGRPCRALSPRELFFVAAYPLSTPFVYLQSTFTTHIIHTPTHTTQGGRERKVREKEGAVTSDLGICRSATPGCGRGTGNTVAPALTLRSAKCLAPQKHYTLRGENCGSRVRAFAKETILPIGDPGGLFWIPTVFLFGRGGKEQIQKS